jgi:hypothetical protein
MADNEQREAEKVEAARRRAEYANKIDAGEITRVVRPGDGDVEYRSRYGLGREVPTLPTGMLGRRLQSLAAANSQQDAPEPAAASQTEQPATQQDQDS